jgi:hypothetical protein
MLALRVAARWQRRLADVIGDPERLIQKFEVVLDVIAQPEKSLPVILEAENFWKTEGHLYTWEVLKQMRDQNDPRLEMVNLYKSAVSKLAFQVSNSSILFQRVEAMFLFLGILQQYDLPPKIRKVIEAAAKYHGTRRKTPKQDVSIEAYTKMMSTLRGQLAAAKEAIAQGKPRGQAQTDAAPDELRAGPFRVVNTGGFDDKTMVEAQAVVEKANQLLQAKGLGRICYGDVLVSRTLTKQNVLAFYLVEKDELFVRANLRGKQHDAVRTICHELGHRLHFKFLKSKDRDIQSIYAKIARKTSWVDKKDKIQEVLKDHPILPGDTLVGKANRIYEVVGTGYGRGGLQVELRRKDDPSQKAHIGLEGYLMTKGLLTTQDLSSFVTGYAAKDHEENFAEMIAYWCQDKLPEDQVEMLKTVL